MWSRVAIVLQHVPDPPFPWNGFTASVTPNHCGLFSTVPGDTTNFWKGLLQRSHRGSELASDFLFVECDKIPFLSYGQERSLGGVSRRQPPTTCVQCAETERSMGVSDSVALVGAVVAILGSAVPILSKIVKA